MSDVRGHNPNAPEDQAAIRLASEATAELAKQQKLDDLKWLMQHKSGRRIVWRFLEFTGVYNTTFRVDALQTAFAEGQRAVGLAVLHEVCSDFSKLYIIMLQENGSG